MTARSFTWLAFTVGVFGACGGRAASSGGDDELGGSCAPACAAPDPDAGSRAIASGGSSGSSGAGAVHTSGVAGEMSAAGSGDAGSAGAEAAGGATPVSEGGIGNIAGAGMGAGAGGACANRSSRFASEVLSHAFGDGQSFNQSVGFPKALFGPPSAGNPNAVVSLGNGGWVVLGFSGNAIVDGPGVDFTVFENPLPTFHELGTVAVSDDAVHWTEFSCTASQDAVDFGYCAGVGVVNSTPNNGIDPLDPSVSGGDHYDLAEIGVAHARYVRITDRVDLVGSAGVFDLDAVAIVNAECP